MKKKITIIGLTALCATLIYGVWVEPYWIEVNHLYLEAEGFSTGLAGKTAIHLTDLHIAEIGRRERRILELIRNVDPDYVFLTGDYVTWKGDYAPAIEFLRLLGDKSKTLAVMGDYDYGNSRKSCLFCHEPGTGRPQKRHAVRFLRNSAVVLKNGDTEVTIAGADEHSEKEFLKRESLNFGQNGFPSVVLAHDPKSFEKIDKNHNTLVLSGNTHGGQVPLPSWIWEILGYAKNAKYNQGLFKDGNKLMYVSRGLGTSHVQFRLFCRPEVVVIHF